MFNSKKIPWVSFLISVQGYLFLSWLFIQALLYPLKNLGLLYTTGIVILIIEFLNIHSSIMLNLYQERLGREIRPLPKLFLLFIYSIFIVFLGIFSENIYIPIIFFVSMVSKILASKVIPSGLNTYQFKLYLTTLIIAILGASLWEHLFSFPLKVYEARPENITGILVDRPQTLVVWGVSYYLTLGIIEIILFVNKKKSSKI